MFECDPNLRRVGTKQPGESEERAGRSGNRKLKPERSRMTQVVLLEELLWSGKERTCSRPSKEHRETGKTREMQEKKNRKVVWGTLKHVVRGRFRGVPTPVGGLGGLFLVSGLKKGSPKQSRRQKAVITLQKRKTSHHRRGGVERKDLPTKCPTLRKKWRGVRD